MVSDTFPVQPHPEGKTVKKRIFTRVDVSMAAAIRADNLSILCKVVNLSLKGLFVKTSITIPPGEMVNVLVYGPNRKFYLHATVVHSGNTGTGLRIDRIGAISLPELKGIMESALNSPATNPAVPARVKWR